MREPQPGEAFTVDEVDYKFGVGDLRVEIVEVVDSVCLPEGGRVELWWYCRALTKPATDTYAAWSGNPRSIYLRVAALRRRGGSEPP